MVVQSDLLFPFPIPDSSLQEIHDVDEEAFLLFSQTFSQGADLGIVNPTSTSLNFPSASPNVKSPGKDWVIEQSPGILASSRGGGTTGAVLWKVTPAFIQWLCTPKNILLQAGIISPTTVLLELGCGTAGLVPLCLSPLVARYIATDQNYVFRILRDNLHANLPPTTQSSNPISTSASKKSKNNTVIRPKRRPVQASPSQLGNIQLLPLDWETDAASSIRVPDTSKQGVDVILACDCIYNENLIVPFVRTCADLCRLRQANETLPTICIVAQHLRSDLVFEAWLLEFHRHFHVWRVVDHDATSSFAGNTGLVIHLGIWRQDKFPAG